MHDRAQTTQIVIYFLDHAQNKIGLGNYTTFLKYILDPGINCWYATNSCAEISFIEINRNTKRKTFFNSQSF